MRAGRSDQLPGPRQGPGQGDPRKGTRTWSACRRSRCGATAPPSLGPVLINKPEATTVKYDFLQLLLDAAEQGQAALQGRRRPGRVRLRGPGRRQRRPRRRPRRRRPARQHRGQRPADDARRDPRPGRRRRQHLQPAERPLQPPAGRESRRLRPKWSSPAAGPASTRKVRGSRKFHFVDTHLEAFDNEAEYPSVRAQQAGGAGRAGRPGDEQAAGGPGRRPQLRHQDRSQAGRRPGLPGDAPRPASASARPSKPTGCCIESSYDLKGRQRSRTSTTRSTTS